jgi:hypothetical protein
VVFVRPQVVETDGLQRISFVFDRSEKAGVEAELIDVRDRISSGRFEGLTSWDEGVCADCAISGGVCALTRPRT